MFVNENDYSLLIRTEILNTVKNTDALPKAEMAAQAEMESFLNARFDVVNIFNKSNDQRNPIILMYLIDMVLYHLHTNISPRNIPELRGIRYEAAIEWLKLVAAGKLNPDLPKLPENPAHYLLAVGGNKKYSEGW